MSWLSIIIPSLDGSESLETTLASVLQNRPDACEVLVVHAQPYDDPYDLGDEVVFVEQSAGSTRTQLINAALEIATGDVVHLLLSGAEVEEGWTEPALKHFDDPDVACVAPLIFDTPVKERVVTQGVAYHPAGVRRSMRIGGQGPTLWAGFYRPAALDEVGGLDACVGDHLADVDASLSFATLGYRSVSEPLSRIFIREKVAIKKDGMWQRGKQEERLFWKHLETAGSKLAHARLWLTELVLSLVYPPLALKLLGRLMAGLQTRPYREHTERMSAVLELKRAIGKEEEDSGRRYDKPHGRGGSRIGAEDRQQSAGL